jgi:hypothetical protein
MNSSPRAVGALEVNRGYRSNEHQLAIDDQAVDFKSVAAAAEGYARVRKIADGRKSSEFAITWSN